jgi:hypothetical protein
MTYKFSIQSVFETCYNRPLLKNLIPNCAQTLYIIELLENWGSLVVAVYHYIYYIGPRCSLVCYYM